MKVQVILLLFTMMSLVYSERSPAIVRITEDQIKGTGGTVELSCSVLYAQMYTVLWEKLDRERNGDPIIISSDTTRLITDSRFSLRYDTASTTYTLQIKDVQDSDTGIYRCVILISQNNYISQEVNLQIHSPPIIFDNSSSTVVANENETVSLECYSGGVPKPQISWKRENNAVLPTGGTVYRGTILKINQIRKEDRGTYFCIADNKVGKSVKKSIAVDVEFPPKIHAAKREVYQAPHFDADLECKIEAFPEPIITWSKDGVQLTNTMHYKTSQINSVDEYKDSTLRVLSIEPNQYGTYICKAVNKLGEAEARIDLYQSDQPICPPACGSGYSSGGFFSRLFNSIF